MNESISPLAGNLGGAVDIRSSNQASLNLAAAKLTFVPYLSFERPYYSNSSPDKLFKLIIKSVYIFLAEHPCPPNSVILYIR